MYFEGVIAIDKETELPVVLEVRNRDDIYAADYYESSPEAFNEEKELKRSPFYIIASLLRHERSTAPKLYTPSMVLDNLRIGKFPLGWFNYPSGAMYLSSRSERSVRKGYCPARIKYYNPYVEQLEARYSELALKVERNENEEFDEDMFRQLDNLRNIINMYQPNYLNTHSMLSKVRGSILRPSYPTFEEAHEVLAQPNPEVPSLALSREFCLTITRHFNNGNAALVYHKKTVGAMLDSRLMLFESFDDLLPQLERSTGIQGELM